MGMTESEVYQLIQASAKKSCRLDPLPTSLLMSSLDELLPSITRIVNCSMSLGHLLTEWKAALVDPRLKKSGQNAFLSNLKPVSNLQFISKLTERAVYNQTCIQRSSRHTEQATARRRPSLRCIMTF